MIKLVVPVQFLSSNDGRMHEAIGLDAQKLDFAHTAITSSNHELEEAKLAL